jgi:hypothetical protein
MARSACCEECGAEVGDGDGPVHAYVPAAPACWEAFSTLQAAELERFGRASAHGLVVDAYMAQHPGDGADPRARRSPIIHLVGLCARFEGALEEVRVGPLLQRTAEYLRGDGAPDAAPLRGRAEPGRLTVLDLARVIHEVDGDAYHEAAHAWALEVWRTWSHEHERIRALHARMRALDWAPTPRSRRV